jgi:hypothetical protein
LNIWQKEILFPPLSYLELIGEISHTMTENGTVGTIPVACVNFVIYVLSCIVLAFLLRVDSLHLIGSAGCEDGASSGYSKSEFSRP